MTESKKNIRNKYNIRPTRKYLKGYVYIIIGSSPIITWEAECAHTQLETEPIHIFDYSFSELQSLTEFMDPFSQNNYLYVVNSDRLGEIVEFSPDPNCCLIIAIDIGLKSEEERKKIVKDYEPINSDYIKVIDLTKFSFFSRKVFKEWYDSLDTRQQQIAEIYKQNPWQLCRLMHGEESFEESDVEDYLENKDSNDINYLLSCLGRKEGIKVWSDLNKSTTYRLFLTPEQEFSGSYTILSGGIKSPKSKGLKYTSKESWDSLMPSLTVYKNYFVINKGKCPELWYYFRKFSKKYLERWKYLPNEFLLIFSTWVSICTNSYRNKYSCGFERRLSKNNKEYYIFSPSNEAIALLDSIIDSSSYRSYNV